MMVKGLFARFRYKTKMLMNTLIRLWIDAYKQKKNDKNFIVM